MIHGGCLHSANELRASWRMRTVYGVELRRWRHSMDSHHSDCVAQRSLQETMYTITAITDLYIHLVVE
jgi:hypothetical protein